MRSLLDMDTIQIEITNACDKFCSNCTRFHGKNNPFYMTFEQFKIAIDSMIEYPKMIGIMGGEPLLHPQFVEFCEYARSKIPYEKLGLWTGLPDKYKHYREVICKTFKHIFINDHSRNDVFHHPHLVAIEEVVSDKNIMWQLIDHCWAQESWSASINPRGAWFCEIAASMSILFNESEGWNIEKGWWNRIPIDFKSQMEKFCPKCGMAVASKRRISNEGIIDISPKNYERLNYEDSRFSISDCKCVPVLEPLASYKDFTYRNDIAKRYNMFLTINENGFWTSHLYKKCEYDYIKIEEIKKERPKIKSKVLEYEIKSLMCKGCGKCCDGSTYDFVPLEEDEFNRLTKLNGKRTYKFGYSYHLNQRGGCGFLIDKRCSIYEDRPRVCKQYICEQGEQK
jgi:hypothetical protein